MTCIIGLIDSGRVYIGADSASVDGIEARASKIQKVFHRGPFLIGCTTSWRMLQLLEHQLEVPNQDDNESDMSFMVTRFVDSVRELLKNKGFTKIENNREQGGQFLVGYRGSVYSIHGDFQVNQSADGFDSVGGGYHFALAAMKALEGLQPEERIHKALEITAHYCTGVFQPFVIKSQGK